MLLGYLLKGGTYRLKQSDSRVTVIFLSYYIIVVMVSSVLSSFVCVLYVILLPAVWADYCSSYVDANGYSHQAVQCGSQYCCGTCERRGCCTDRMYRITLEQQQRCPGSPTSDDKKSKLATLLGSILGSVFPIILCVGLIICCLAPCCLFYKKCRKGGNQRSQTPRNTTTVINVPQQPHPPASGFQPSYPGYQPVPAQPGYGGPPMPTAPPSYIRTDNPANPSPGVYPMVPYPGQPYAPSPQPDVPLPYNPSYAQNP